MNLYITELIFLFVVWKGVLLKNHVEVNLWLKFLEILDSLPLLENGQSC